MPREASGSAFQKGAAWYAKITIGAKDRKTFTLATCADKRAADARAVLLADLAQRLRRAGVPRETALRLLRLASEREGKALDDVTGAIDAMCKGDARTKLPERERVTFQDVAKRWTSGE